MIRLLPQAFSATSLSTAVISGVVESCQLSRTTLGQFSQSLDVLCALRFQLLKGFFKRVVCPRPHFLSGPSQKPPKDSPCLQPRFLSVCHTTSRRTGGAALHSGEQSESPVLMRLTASWEIQTRTLQHDSPGPEENAEPGEVSLLWNPHSHTLEAKSFPSELSSEHPKEGARKAEGLLDLLEGPLVSVTGSGLGLDRLVEFWKISIPRSNLPAGSSQRVCCSWTGPFSSRGEKAVYPAPKEAFFSRGCQGGKQEEASGACPLLAPSRAR
ncbi:uncharacterized protein LOC116742650 isoform X3 [Phocoena sinus]|uniref:uncharacterized protein LOC116742650 isoform X3 n=1 Tax=Phocoena sinus TaxID=42100 RepID=UPI0013C42E27|nr:uncharacterized protein LOC116742650 isoform X3 [Phocoena sinus]